MLRTVKSLSSVAKSDVKPFPKMYFWSYDTGLPKYKSEDFGILAWKNITPQILMYLVSGNGNENAKETSSQA